MAKRVGVVLARLMPIHNGHLELIKFAAAQNDEVLILIGSADKLNERNPIPIDFREETVREAIDEAQIKNVTIAPLADLTSESDNSVEWGFYLYANIIKHMNFCFPTIYYSDGAEIILKWFPGFLLKNYVSLCLMARGTVEDGISATEVRKMIEGKASDEELLKVVPKCIVDNAKYIRSFIQVHKGNTGK